MLDNIANFLNRVTTWRAASVTIATTILLFAVYLDYIQPLRDYGGGAVHLDIRFGGYMLADVLAYFGTLGAEGRSFYAKTTLFDTIWPLGVALSGALWAPLAFRRSGLVVAAAFCPVMFGTLDLFENVGLWIMLAQYPDVSPAVAGLGNAITLAKQAMIPGATLAIPTLPLIAVLRKSRRPGLA